MGLQATQHSLQRRAQTNLSRAERRRCFWEDLWGLLNSEGSISDEYLASPRDPGPAKEGRVSLEVPVTLRIAWACAS